MVEWPSSPPRNLAPPHYHQTSLPQNEAQHYLPSSSEYTSTHIPFLHRSSVVSDYSTLLPAYNIDGSAPSSYKSKCTCLRENPTAPWLVAEAHRNPLRMYSDLLSSFPVLSRSCHSRNLGCARFGFEGRYC
jgi:hypothetical protein